MADLRLADDDSILGDERLYFRIYPSPDALKQVEDGQFRPITGAVKGRDLDKPMSVDLGSLSTPEQTRDRGTNGNFHVAMITAAVVRNFHLRLRRDPVVNGPVLNPAHSLICGSRTNANGDQVGGLTDGEYSKVARAARMVLITQQPPP